MRLKDKVAIVTGAASGIGRAIALRFAEEGANVCCVADINIDGIKNTAEEIQRMGRKAIWVQADVAKISDIDKMVAATVDSFGKIDILVNNAGVSLRNPIPDVTEEDWDRSMNVMLKGSFFGTQRVLPHMLKQGKGKVINLASTYGQVGALNNAAYCTAKGGIINMTRQLALELAPQKINVNALGPGPTYTPLSKPIFDDPEKLRPFLTKVPYGRVAQPEEIAAAAVYLASDESDFVNGHTLFIDGGYLIQ